MTYTHTSVVLAVIAAALAGGCSGGGERSARTTTTSGSPEADQRANMRVDEDEGGGEADNRTLYERLGGEETIAALVDDLTTRVVNDPRVNFDRSNVKTGWLAGKYEPWRATDENVARFKRHMVEFLTLAAGGPAEYTGRDMKSLHKDMKITNTEFDAMVGDIKASLDRLGIRGTEAKEVLAIIETTRKQIVEER